VTLPIETRCWIKRKKKDRAKKGLTAKKTMVVLYTLFLRSCHLLACLFFADTGMNTHKEAI